MRLITVRKFRAPRDIKPLWHWWCCGISCGYGKNESWDVVRVAVLAHLKGKHKAVI